MVVIEPGIKSLEPGTINHKYQTGLYFLPLKYDSIKIENRIFAGNWIDYAINKLKWDKRKLAFVVSSLHISFTEYEYSLSRLRDVKAIASENTETKCDCNTGTDFCNYEPGLTCSSTGCKASSSGCGWLWMEECNGNCI